MAWQVNQVRGDKRTRVEVPSRHAARDWLELFGWDRAAAVEELPDGTFRRGQETAVSIASRVVRLACKRGPHSRDDLPTCNPWGSQVAVYTIDGHEFTHDSGSYQYAAMGDPWSVIVASDPESWRLLGERLGLAADDREGIGQAFRDVIYECDERRSLETFA